MKKIAGLCVVLLTVGAGSFAVAAPPQKAAEMDKFGTGQLQQQAAQVEAATQPKPSKDGVLFIPQFFSVHNSANTTNLSDGMGGKLRMGSGDTYGAGFMVLGTKEVNDMLSFSAAYQYIRMDYSGSGVSPTSIPNLSVDDDLTVDSHGLFLFSDLDFKKYGRVQFNFIQGFDFFSGDRTTTVAMPGTTLTQKNTMDDFSARTTSFMGWYEFDVPLSTSVMLTPYVGWRTFYVDIKNMMGDGIPADDKNMWVHLASGGVKASYQNGLFGMSLRGGINHRVSHDDAPGYSIRAVEKNVAFPGFNVSLDRTIGTYGVGASYVFPGYGVLFGGYDGFSGANTNAHIGTLGWVLPF